MKKVLVITLALLFMLIGQESGNAQEFNMIDLVNSMQGTIPDRQDPEEVVIAFQALLIEKTLTKDLFSSTGGDNSPMSSMTNAMMSQQFARFLSEEADMFGLKEEVMRRYGEPETQASQELFIQGRGR